MVLIRDGIMRCYFVITVRAELNIWKTNSSLGLTFASDNEKFAPGDFAIWALSHSQNFSELRNSCNVLEMHLIFSLFSKKKKTYYWLKDLKLQPTINLTSK